ncbi:putative metallo-hydrolase [Pontivivens insulae]|uniref:Putative metallo-hydrolase n=2 Tax=Pontivivens insulae TaxID=1639689 RepID=A0A2R8A9N6_9RHOB|nr:MBL fold metallo-hydrolase [Pontivivens insulae]RED12835.1 glyoxylase-like metal-dependent hydrolase (beta-lactamase superfamily II) [Pontivivens insulae]SPF28926.1 putative metallo-hydrolase [Pontivivens insulae]
MIDTKLTRRGALALGGAAIASPALAQVPMMGTTRQMYRRVKIGDFEVTTLLDAVRAVPDPHNIFGTDQDPADVAALLEANNLPTGQAEFTFSPTLVNTGSELILFDTGNGPQEGGTSGLVTQMEAAGYSADQVDTVVLTHMHPDHIGGMTDAAGAATFSNAAYVTGATEYNMWSQAGNDLFNAKVAPFAEQMRMIEPGDSVASGVEAVAAFGHTPGHMAYHIESAGQRLMLIADAANHFVLSMERPDWEVRFDQDKAAAAQTRKDLLGMIAADGIPFVGYHMPFPAIGYLEAAGDGFEYTPETYQLAF